MSDHPHPIEHPHPTAGVYLRIAAILAILTALEVAVYYILTDQLASLLPPTLIVLSALKFGLVVAYYMHLKFDNALFTGLFLGGLLIALSLVLALMTLFGTWTHVPTVH